MLILYNPPSSSNKKPVLPMSLLALGAKLEGRHEYMIVDGNLLTDPQRELDRLVREKQVDRLAVTVMPGPQLSQAVPLCRDLKARHPRLTIIWGGYFPTQHWDVCLKAPYIDYVVRGHGDQVFVDLLDGLDHGLQSDGFEGLAYRHAETNKITSNNMAAIPHPDMLPEYPYHRIDMNRYIRRTFMGKRTLPHHSSYGCPFFCNFCAVVNMVGGKWVAQSAERTAGVVENLVKTWQLDAVEFYDNNFFTQQSRVAEFSERIVPLNVRWWGEGRVDTMLNFSDTTWQLMEKSGLRMVFLGAETGSDATLKRMDKGGTAATEKTLEIAAKMETHNMVPEFSFVLGNPPEPEKDMEESLQFIRKIKRINPKSEIIMYLYTPVPLSGALYEQAKEDGFVFPETLEEWVSDAWQDFNQRRSTTMPWVQDPLRRKMLNFERVLNAYYPTATDIKLTAFRRFLLRTASAWRYHTRIYRGALELRALQKFMAYQRPDTSGF
ncbi:MAG TPA: B12-binding domain-containing radical SAM protein [candidate division Zixibacteria bacterium]|nr:B12-binding domain-containing radical SAM protein [candidate division Zixibacteria bacterium]